MLPPIEDETNPAVGSGANFASTLIKKGGLTTVESVNSMGGGSVMSGHDATRSFVVSQQRKPKILSMSTNLGAKAKAFGTVGIKKKKKKTKKKGKKKKRQKCSQ